MPGEVLGLNAGPDVNLAHISWKDVQWGDWKMERDWTGDIALPPAVRNNDTSIWAHIFMAADGSPHRPYDSGFQPRKVHHVRRQLVRYMPRKRVVKEKNLLSAKEEEVVEEEPELDVRFYSLYQNLTLALIADNGPIPLNKLAPPMVEHVHFIPPEKGFPNARYYPVIFPNTFWQLSSYWQPYTAQNETLPLHIDFHALSFMKFQIYASMSASFEQQAAANGGSASSEIDEVKRMFMETNPILLIVTAIVSVLHMLFEFLAFAADVGHWRKKNEFTGVSVRSIATNVFVQVIILLYLIDNNEETSWMILFGQGSGALIEAWKVTKILNFAVVPAPAGSLIPYKILVTDKHVLTEDEKKTQEYDRLAFRYVAYVAIPLLIGYTGYSLVYEPHKGWYSFTIKTLTSYVYMFGFAQLVPQLIINYKLKSVAHLPMKAFVYKFLGTIVDDFFAFCIKMPFLHRLACFRDDVVFLIMLYQRWIYRVDPKRVNEYGQVMVSEEGETPQEKKDK
ncbi:cleft lip and palate transmembrane 1 [Clavulina sp. PMI_390]|nr:cleft lip and palate transmembrane 1 [Clavulina sp. PMI_390]